MIFLFFRFFFHFKFFFLPYSFLYRKIGHRAHGSHFWTRQTAVNWRSCYVHVCVWCVSAKRCSQKTKIATERPHAYFAAQISSLRWAFIPAKYNGIKINLLKTGSRVAFFHQLYSFEQVSRSIALACSIKKNWVDCFFLYEEGKKPDDQVGSCGATS